MKKYLSPANIITVVGGFLAFIGMTAYFTESVNLSVPTFFYGVPILLIGLGLKTSEIPPVKLFKENDDLCSFNDQFEDTFAESATIGIILVILNLFIFFISSGRVLITFFVIS